MTTRIGNANESVNAEKKVRFASPDNISGLRLDIPDGYRSGWLTRLNFYVTNPSPIVMQVQLALYADEAAGGGKLYAGPTSSATRGDKLVSATLSTTAGKDVRLEAGKSYWVIGKGSPYFLFWHDPDASAVWGHKQGTTLPDSWTGFARETANGDVPAELFYQENADPSTGIPSSPTANEVVNTSQPVFSGSIRHDNGDSAYDYTKAVQLQVWRVDTGAIVYDNTIEISETERANKVFSQSPIVLPTGTNLKWKYRHQDSWGAWSQWSVETQFSCARGPLAPTIDSPSGKVNQISGITYSGIYSSDTSLPSNAIQVRVLNSLGTAVIYDSGVVPKTVAAGGTYNHAQWHPDLSWGVSYQVEIRFRSRNEFNTADVWGPYTREAFNTNAKPYPPTSLSPTGNRVTGSGLIKATATDPDGDLVTEVRLELFDTTINATVPGYAGKNILAANQATPGVDLSGYSATNCSITKV